MLLAQVMCHSAQYTSTPMSWAAHRTFLVYPLLISSRVLLQSSNAPPCKRLLHITHADAEVNAAIVTIVWAAWQGMHPSELLSWQSCPTLFRQTFQYFGLDFLVDAALHPWLMEVNATPSMKVAHSEPDTQRLVHEQKWRFVHDTFQLLRIHQHTFDEVSLGWGTVGLSSLQLTRTTSVLCQCLLRSYSVNGPLQGLLTLAHLVSEHSFRQWC